MCISSKGLFPFSAPLPSSRPLFQYRSLPSLRPPPLRPLPPLLFRDRSRRPALPACRFPSLFSPGKTRLFPPFSRRIPYYVYCAFLKIWQPYPDSGPRPGHQIVCMHTFVNADIYAIIWQPSVIPMETPFFSIFSAFPTPASRGKGFDKRRKTRYTFPMKLCAYWQKDYFRAKIYDGFWRKSPQVIG